MDGRNFRGWTRWVGASVLSALVSGCGAPVPLAAPSSSPKSMSAAQSKRADHAEAADMSAAGAALPTATESMPPPPPAPEAAPSPASARALAPSPASSPVLAPSPAQGVPQFSTESYAQLVENAFVDTANQPLSTFGVDVDTASFSNVRRFLEGGAMPPKDAVRIEELVNYFPYDYSLPKNGAPVGFGAEVASCPWASDHRLVRIGLKARTLEANSLPPRNLVFLVDVSGSMNEPKKLPLVVQSLNLLVDQLSDRDTLAIVVYAGSEGLALPPTSGHRKAEIRNALERLAAGGSTNGGSGIRLAYQIARQNFRKGGINRVLLATDGDFNVGVTNLGELQTLIEEEKKSGVFLTVLGVGSGNTKDSTMMMLADKGNGNYAYLDSLQEARKVLVTQAGSTLVTVAKDVKVQIEYNPAHVQAYRLIGYEKRNLRAEDFRDDKKDAGEMGAGHSVTALYEVVPKGAAKVDTGSPAPLRYQATRKTTAAAGSGELLTIKIRYKEPEAETSKELSQAVVDPGTGLGQASGDFKFASSVAAFGMLLRSSPYKGSSTFGMVRSLAESGLGTDPNGYRREFLRMISLAEKLGSPMAIAQ